MADLLLAHINSPEDLRKLPVVQLPRVCAELRQFIIEQVAVNGGHLGASLGTVELTVALHYVFNTPDDMLVWDVGHQAYGHKILTGRRQLFYTNRKYRGISGFPKRSESIYDTFGTGHSSTSISAALGMAVASRLSGQHDRQHIAVIGDGAMTAGLAFEALNNATVNDVNLLIVLNDNGMSIDPNVGALKQHLLGIATPHAVTEHNFFEAMGIPYAGNADGHDVIALVEKFRELKSSRGVKVLHCLTVKGKGYAEAESDQVTWHAPGLFDKVTGKIVKKVNTEKQPPRYQDVFGHTLLELARQNEKIIGVTPAMLSGSSMNIMMKAMPERTFDVGIAEQHAVTFSAGLAANGLVPFCNIYSTFMQRAYDQVIHDVCVQNLHVVFCLDRAGLVGADGATHHGVFDLAYMRCLPNLVVAAPMNEEELRNLMYTAQLPHINTAFSIRYPRGQGVMPEWQTPLNPVEVGSGRMLREGKDVAILTIGHTGNFALQACERLAGEALFPAHYDMRFVKPLDEKLLHTIFATFTKVVTVEDGCIQGGFGSAILEFMADHQYMATVTRLGIPDRFIEHGEPGELFAECNYNAVAIAGAVRELCGMKQDPVIS